MSLIKQLWIAVSLLMLLAFIGSLVVSTLSAKQYLQQQLQLKNHDNATSLALSMSQMEKDPVTLELLLAAQFDTGHYQRIVLSDPFSNVIHERHYDESPVDGAPAWFVRLVPLCASAGLAQVHDGWRQYGTLLVESHSRFAYAALWNGTLRLLQWFLIAAIVAGIIGTWILKLITRPLGSVVAQAEAIGERRFITSSEPRTREFRLLAHAMNSLSERVRAMLEKEARQLEEYRRLNQHDGVTSLANREHFLNLLDSTLNSHSHAGNGILILIRVTNLADVNSHLGHIETDKLLASLAHAIRDFAADRLHVQCGRIRNSDLALLLPATHDPIGDLKQLADRLQQILDSYEEKIRIGMPIGAATYYPGETRANLLARLDGALAVAEQQGDRALNLIDDSAPPAHIGLEDWRHVIGEALATRGIVLEYYPVMDTDGKLLHMEAPARLYLDGALHQAAYFVPWAARLDMMPEIDITVIKQALQHIRSEKTPVAVNLSGEALHDGWFRSELLHLLRQAPDEAHLLWIELPEAVALRCLDEFKAFCQVLHPLGCRIGMDHVSSGFVRIGELHELGLDYIKIDGSLIRHIEQNSANQTFLRGLCTIAHSIGLLALAEGVEHDEEKTCLTTLGLDGVTGPLIPRTTTP